MKTKSKKFKSSKSSFQERIYPPRNSRQYEFSRVNSRRFYRQRYGYDFNPEYEYANRSIRTYPRKNDKNKFLPRPVSPILGSEEYMKKKIEQTSAIIMKQLLNPEQTPFENIKQSNEEDRAECSTINTQERSEIKESGNNCKTKQKKSTTYNIDEIHEKIMNHITNLKDGKKKNLINFNMSSYDIVINQIQKQRRLEISRALRAVCSNSENIKESSNFINSIIPDIGIKIEELPQELIEELSNTLNLDSDWSGDDFLFDSDSELNVMSPEMKEGAHWAPRACVNLIPESSKDKYMNAYNSFNNWREEQCTDLLSENVFLAYFGMLSSKFKPSTLWAQYSMLRMTVNINNEIDISKYAKLRGFLKRKSDGYRPRKSKIFTPKEINKFISEAPDSEYLLTKVLLIMGVVGACRRNELYKMKMADIKDLGSAILVDIPNTQVRVARKFVITGRFYDIFKKYAALRPQNANHSGFFLNYQRGKCTVQKIGINKIGQMGKQIAKYLNLANPELYTGHCFRKSSATVLVDNEGDVSLKRRGGWKSAEVTEECIGSNELFSANVLDRSDASTFEKSCTEIYVKPDFVDPKEYKIDNETTLHYEGDETESSKIIAPCAIKKEIDYDGFEHIDINSNDAIDTDYNTNHGIDKNNDQNISENPVTIKEEIFEQSDAGCCNLKTGLESNYQGQSRSVIDDITPENSQDDIQQFKHDSLESKSSNQIGAEKNTGYASQFNGDRSSYGSNGSKVCHKTKEGVPIKEQDTGVNLNIDKGSNCFSKTDMSTQTEENMRGPYCAETYIDKLLAEAYKKTPKSFFEAVNRMLEIDRCILKLTNYRQLLFTKRQFDESSISKDNAEATNYDFHKRRFEDNRNNAQLMTSLPKKRKKNKSKKFNKAKKLNTVIPESVSNDLEQDFTNNDRDQNSIISKCSERPCNENENKNKEYLEEKDKQSNDKKKLREILKFPVMQEKILVIKVMEDKLVAGTESGKIIFFNLENGLDKKTLNVCGVPITSILFIKQDIPMMYVGSFNPILKIYNSHNRSIIENVSLEDSIQCMENNWGYIFLGCTEGSLLRYSLKKRAIESEDKISDSSILVVKATQEGARRVLLIGSRNAPVCIRDAITGLYMRTMENIFSPTVYSLILEKSLVYCGTTNHDILVYSFHDGKLIQRHKATDSKGIGCMKVVNNLLFASCHNGKIYVYDIKNNTFISEIQGPGGVILAMEIFENQIVVSTMSFKFISLPIPENILKRKM